MPALKLGHLHSFNLFLKRGVLLIFCCFVVSSSREKDDEKRQATTYREDCASHTHTMNIRNHCQDQKIQEKFYQAYLKVLKSTKVYY